LAEAMHQAKKHKANTLNGRIHKVENELSQKEPLAFYIGYILVE